MVDIRPSSHTGDTSSDEESYQLIDDDNDNDVVKESPAATSPETEPKSRNKDSPNSVMNQCKICTDRPKFGSIAELAKHGSDFHDDKGGFYCNKCNDLSRTMQEAIEHTQLCEQTELKDISPVDERNKNEEGKVNNVMIDKNVRMETNKKDGRVLMIIYVTFIILAFIAGFQKADLANTQYMVEAKQEKYNDNLKEILDVLKTEKASFKYKIRHLQRELAARDSEIDLLRKNENKMITMKSCKEKLDEAVRSKAVKIREKDNEINHLKKELENKAGTNLTNIATNNHREENINQDVEINNLKIQNEKYQKKIEELTRTKDEQEQTAMHLLKVQQEKLKHLEALMNAANIVPVPKIRSKKVTLTAPNGSFGFAIRKHSVLKVHAGTPAHHAGVKRGDQLVSIDEVNVETFTHEMIMEMVRNAKAAGHIVLELQKNHVPLSEQERLWNKAS